MMYWNILIISTIYNYPLLLHYDCVYGITIMFLKVFFGE